MDLIPRYHLENQAFVHFSFSLMTLENLSLEDHFRIRRLFAGRLDPEMFDSVRSWIRQCFHRPSDTELIMVACNEILEGFGVECLRGEWLDDFHHDIQASYVNMGDCYLATVIRDHMRERWLMTTVGDLVEKNPDRFR